MIECSHCKHNNKEGFLFCEECGRGLIGLPSKMAPTIPTRVVGSSDPVMASGKATWGTAFLSEQTEIQFHVRGVDDAVSLESNKHRFILGRSDQNSTVKPDIDLAPYNAIEKGVSRQHAAIERNEDTLMLMDIGSSNGTYLNGQRLPTNQPRILRDGDEVRLGKLIAHIYFK